MNGTTTLALFTNVTDSTMGINTTLGYDNSTFSDALNTTTARPAAPGLPELGYYGETRIKMWKIIPPIIMVWGIVGNFLTVIVLSRQLRKKMSSTPLYLIALAVSDSIILLCGPLRNFILYNWDIEVRNLSDVGCRIQLFFTYAGAQVSSWLLVAVTVERLISVILPHKVRLGCTPKTATMFIAAIFFCIFGLNVCIPVIHSQHWYRNRYRCAPTDQDDQDFRDDIWVWIDFCMVFAIPFVILLVSNTIIIVHLCKSRRQQKKMTTSRTASAAKTKSVSVLLVMLCFVFLTTMTPVSVFLIYYPYRYKEIQKIPLFVDAYAAYQHLLYQHTIVNIVSYTNASLNFVLYVLSGPKFRNEFKDLLCCLSKRPKKKLPLAPQTKSTSVGTTSDSSRRSVTNGAITDVSGDPQPDTPLKGTDNSTGDMISTGDHDADHNNDNMTNLARVIAEEHQTGNQDLGKTTTDSVAEIGNNTHMEYEPSVEQQVGNQRLNETIECNVENGNESENYTNKAYEPSDENQTKSTDIDDIIVDNVNS